MAATPRLTVVTANLNHGSFLEQAIRSVTEQPGVVLEHLVVDGGSLDRSVAIVEASGTARLALCPGLDSHAALNRGLALAEGALIGFLNADDRYESASLHRVVAAFDAAPGTVAVCGGLRFFRCDDGPEGTREVELGRYEHAEGDGLLLEATFGAPGFNSWFFRTDWLRSLGGLRTEWRFAADRDLLLRLLAAARPTVLRGTVYHYRVHEGSRTLDPRKTNRSAWAREHIRLARLHAADDWSGDPERSALLDDWRALEGLKLLAGLHRDVSWRSDLLDLFRTPWWRLPSALLRRRQWLATAAR
ncbi:glycosyltransferase [Tistlia consotensis]|nr:glycosyltransferase [Tistlia consotensis]